MVSNKVIRKYSIKRILALFIFGVFLLTGGNALAYDTTEDTIYLGYCAVGSSYSHMDESFEDLGKKDAHVMIGYEYSHMDDEAEKKIFLMRLACKY